MRTDYSKATQNHSRQRLVDALVPTYGISKEKFNKEHVEAALKDAFKNGSIQEPVYGQNNFIAHESLLRPKDKDGKEYSIGKISTLFYEEGLSVEFDVLACSLGMKASKNRPITLNISVQSALTPEFFDEIKKRMDQHKLKNKDIIFEILEHDVDPNADISHLKTLKGERFHFALDDFSIAEKDKTVSKENANRIAALGEIVDFVKIDGPIIRAFFEKEYKGKNRHGKPKSYSKTDFHNTLQIIHETMPHTKIIAERVYNKTEADQLFNMGIEGVQGWDLKDEDFHYTPEAKNESVKSQPEVL